MTQAQVAQAQILLRAAKQGWGVGNKFRWVTRLGQENESGELIVNKLFWYSVLMDDPLFPIAEAIYAKRYLDTIKEQDFIIIQSTNSRGELVYFPLDECELISKILTSTQVNIIDNLIEQL